MTRNEILDEAKNCVCGQREQDYGSPEDNFQIIADFWNAYLGMDDIYVKDKYKFAVREDGGVYSEYIKKPAITPQDVAMMMALLKIARIKNGGGTGDSFVDLAGYAACGGEIYVSKNPKLKTIHPKTGEVVIGGFELESEGGKNESDNQT